MATDGQSFEDIGRSFSERRVAARKSLDRCSFEGPRSKTHVDGYNPAASDYSLARQSGKQLHASGNSSDNLAELAEPEQPRESTVRRPPSMDRRKPRRSESDDGTDSAGRKAAAANGGVPAPTVGNTEEEVYKSTGYYDHLPKTNYTIPGKNPCGCAKAHIRDDE